MAATQAYAEEATEVPVAAEAVPSVNELDLGLGYVSDDAYHFGRYNGLTDQGAYIIGDVKAKGYAEDGWFWRLRGTNLGLDSRYLRFDAGVQGNQQFFIEYDQFPDYENDTASTPFVNPGSTRLLLPDGYDADNLDSYLLPFDQETERKRLGIGGKVFFKSRWELSGNVSHETKEGTDWTGAAMGPSIPDNIFKWTNGALLPEPVDQETDKLNASLRYNGQDTQMEFAYNGSLFYNNNDALEWTDPLKNPSCTCKPGSPGCPPRDQCGDLYRPGRMSLEPDNQMHQLSGLITHALNPTHRLTALASVSRLTQDDKFLPYNADNVVDMLPQNSPEAEVWLYRGQVKLSSRPTRKLRLNAQYSYDQRDNNTDVNSYYYYIADGISAGDVVGHTYPRTNDPLSYTRNKVDLTGNYYINSMFSLHGGYQYLDVNRDYNDNVRETARENTFTGKLRMRANSELNVDFYGEIGRRNGSQYHTRLNENPKLRVFYMADVDREKAGVTISYMPLDRLSFSLTTEYWNDDYTESEIGLRESTQRSAMFDTSYRFTDHLSTHVFYNYDESDINLANENKEVEKGTLDVWEADMLDQIHSFGWGLSLTGMDKWDAGVDWVYTYSRGNIDENGYTAPVDLDGNITGAFTPIDVQPFPDLKTSLSSLQLWAKYRYSDKIAYKLSYWYEDYNTEDWSVDDLTNDSVAQYLLLGEDRLDYTQHVVGLSVNVQF
jgi:MtrB/PioB family decaheme-associated outer membrane protein